MLTAQAAQQLAEETRAALAGAYEALYGFKGEITHEEHQRVYSDALQVESRARYIAAHLVADAPSFLKACGLRPVDRGPFAVVAFKH